MTFLQSKNQALPDICSPTAEKRHITVKSAGVHSAGQNTWKATSSYTLEKNHTSAHNAVTQVAGPILSNDTWPNILVVDFSENDDKKTPFTPSSKCYNNQMICATCKQVHTMRTCSFNCKRSSKTHKIAFFREIKPNCGTTLQSHNKILPNICSPTVERSHIPPKSARAHSLKQ